MRLSVIICTYTTERLQDTRVAIERLRSLDDPDLKIIVVVDRNEELHRIFSKELDESITLILSHDSGLSASRNAGLKVVEDGAVAFLDDDAYPAENWVSRIRAGYADTRAFGVGGRIVPHWYGPKPKWYPPEVWWIIGCTYRGHQTRRGPIRNTFGSNISFRKELLDASGHFDPELGRVDEKNYTAEEMEMCVRLRQANPGMYMLYDPKAIVHHRIYPWRLKLSFTMRRAFWEGVSKAKVAQRREKALGTEQGYIGIIIRAQIRDVPRLLRHPRDAFIRMCIRKLVVGAVGSGFLLAKLKVVK